MPEEKSANFGLIGASLVRFGIGIALVQGGLIRIILKRLGERGTIVFGMAFTFAVFVS